jgi:Zn finger protein HypA/HybF involved in hydrogenase expression
MKKVGKWGYEVTCPLCFNIYICNYNEVHKDKETGKHYFYCPECNRNLYLETEDAQYIRDIVLHKKK